MEKDYIRLKNERSAISKADRQKIIDETKLTKVVMSQFSEGYQGAKEKIRAKMLAASLDTKVLDSSDDEDEAKELPIPPE